MTKEAIAAALEAEGLQAANQNFSVPEGREGAFLIGAPGDIFSIDRVVRVDLRDKYIVVENQRKERFFFSYEDVLGLRLLAAPTRTTGFAR